MKKLKYLTLLNLCSLMLTASVQGGEANSVAVLESLQADMQKYAAIATDTEQNVDYMPYVVSTLTSDTFELLGVHTLREALSLLPGVDISVGMAGVKTPIFHGSNPSAVGQSKLMIDGVLVNDRLFGGYSQYLDMPTDILQRIEVVCGPGSLQSHVSGYAGSIHVITKANRDDALTQPTEVFAAAGSNDFSKGGFVSSYQNNELKLSSDAFYQQHDLELPVGVDRFGNSGETQQDLRNYGLCINGEYRGFSLKARLAKNDSGVSYGQAFSLTDDESDFLDIADKVITPYHFLDVAKKSTIYHQITWKVISIAFEHFARIPDAEFSINLSVEDLLHKETLEFLDQQLDIYDVASRLVLEIVESEGIDSFEEANDFIRKMKARGCRIAIDDFGTGYSNFSYLMQLNVDYIKIDGSLIRNIDHDSSAQVICATIVDFARQLDLRTVAEFVHNEPVLEYTRNMGIDFLQGYHLGEPAPIEVLTEQQRSAIP